MEVRLKADRNVNMRMRGQLSSPSPWRSSQGIMKNRPQKLRQKVMTKPCRSLERNLTWALSPAKHKPAKIVKPAAISTWFCCPGSALKLSKNMMGRHIREKGAPPPLPSRNCGQAARGRGGAEGGSFGPEAIGGGSTAGAAGPRRQRRVQQGGVPRQGCARLVRRGSLYRRALA